MLWPCRLPPGSGASAMADWPSSGVKTASSFQNAVTVLLLDRNALPLDLLRIKAATWHVSAPAGPTGGLCRSPGAAAHANGMGHAAQSAPQQRGPFNAELLPPIFLILPDGVPTLKARKARLMTQWRASQTADGAATAFDQACKTGLPCHRCNATDAAKTWAWQLKRPAGSVYSGSCECEDEKLCAMHRAYTVAARAAHVAQKTGAPTCEKGVRRLCPA